MWRRLGRALRRALGMRMRRQARPRHSLHRPRDGAVAWAARTPATDDRFRHWTGTLNEQGDPDRGWPAPPYQPVPPPVRVTGMATVRIDPDRVRAAAQDVHRAPQRIRIHRDQIDRSREHAD